MSDDPNSPRPHHHRFAHVALPKMILSGPPRMLELLATPMSTPFLMDIWETVGKEVPKGTRMAPDGLAVTTHNLDKHEKVILVTMPTPQRIGESWFVAFVSKPESRRMLFLKTAGSLRCFTLDHTSEGGTTLTERAKDGAQLSAAAGPAPQAQAFVGALADL